MAKRKLNVGDVLKRRRQNETLAALARRFGLKPQALYNFRAKQRDSESSEPDFLPVHVASVPQETPIDYRLEFQSGVTLRIPGDADLQNLGPIVAALKEVL